MTGREQEDTQRQKRDAEIDTVLKGRDTFNSRRRAWSYPFTQPQTMLRMTIFTKVGDAPKHRRCFYPKPMVPMRFVEEPNYKRLAEQVTEVKTLWAQAKEESQVREHVEVLHEIAHLQQLWAARNKWDDQL